MVQDERPLQNMIVYNKCMKWGGEGRRVRSLV